MKKALVAEASEDLPAALALRREALATLEPLATRPAAPAAWSEHARICREAIARLEARLARPSP